MLQKAYTTYLKTTLIVSCLLLFCFNRGITQTNCLQSFQVSFGGNNDDIAYDVADAGNGQYYTAGTTKSFGAGNTDILVTKIASDGSVVWSYAYGAGGDETVRKISATPDGGLVLTGQTKSFSQSQGEIFCMKINSGGHLDWSKRFGDKNDALGDLGLNIIPTSEGGYAFTGIFNVGGHIGDLVIAKLNASGDITWFKRMNSNQGEDGTGLLQEGSDLLVASDLDNNGTNYSSVVMRLNINTGIVASQVEIKPATRGLFGPFLYKDKNGDGYWISAHTTDGYSYNQMQPVILKLDNNFKLVKTYSYKVPGVLTNDYFTGFTQMNDGFVVCASTQSSPTGYLFYINTDGSIKWAKKFAGASGRSLYRLQHLGSKIIAVGKDASQGKGNDFFVEGFGDGGTIDQLCHPDTTAVTITAPAFTENNFTWASVKNQLIDDVSAPVIVSTVALSAKSLCDACPVNVTPSFTIPDTVCVGSPVNITNTTTGASSYFWNFCTADISSTIPTADNLGSFGGKLNRPVFIDVAFQNGNYYGFAINNGVVNSVAKLIRLDFGNSLLNTPTAKDMGTFNGAIPNSAEGIQVVFNENKWYAIIVGGATAVGSTPSVLKLDFGNSLTNTPTATNWGNIGNLSQPIDLYVFKQGANWYGLTVNSNNNTITRFNFSSSFENTPTADNLGNIGGLNYPTGIYAINDNGFWRVFVTNGANYFTGQGATLTRLDFGNSLLNTPTGKNLGNPNGLLHEPRDLTLIKMCGEVTGLIVNGYTNDIIKLNFNNDLTSTPVTSSFGTLGNLNFPHSLSQIFRVGADLYSLIPNVNSSNLTRIKFAGCTNASTPNSSAQNPPSIKYSTPGVYNINLTVDDGLPTQASLCKQVFVAAAPSVKLTGDSVVCLGDSAHLTATGGTSYSWLPTTGITNPTSASIGFRPASTTKYYVTVKNAAGCSAKDSSLVIVSTCSVCDTWAKFTGTKPKIQIGNLAVTGHTITVEAAFNRTSAYSGGYLYAGDLVSKHKDPNDVNYLLRPNDAEITTTDGQWHATFGICEIKLNKTYHVAMVYDGVSLKFYRDGFLMSEVPATGDLVQNNYLTTIGTTAYNQNPHPTDFQGFINEVRIWSVARTQDEIKQYMNSSLPNPSTQNGLLAYYNFSSLKNKQGNKAWDGKIVNGASINQTNTSCDFVADSCDFLLPTCSVNPDFSFKQDACNPKLFQFTNETQNTSSVSWDFGNGKKAGNDLTPAITYGVFGNYNVKLVVKTTTGCIDSVTKNISVNVINDSLIITNDTVLCNPQNLQLNAIPALNYCWSPAKGLSATDIANPVAKITGNITYYVTSQSTGKNLIVNGDFSQGNTGFTSGYAYAAPKNTTEGQYNVDINPSVWNRGMSACTDHSGSNGNMMMVNGNTQPDLQVWSETITVKPNTTYAFSAWLEPLHGQNPAALQFFINGKTIGSIFNAELPTCNWKQFYVTWNSGDTNKATISIINENTIVLGNDFALDDISFAESTIKTDSVVIKTGVPGVKFSPDTTICSGGKAQITAKVPGSIKYQWSPSTGLSNTGIANPVASPVNTTTYHLDATTINGCKITDSVKISVLPQPAVATIADSAICNGEVIKLTTSSNGGTFNWSPAAGLSDASQQSPLANPTKNTQYIITVNPGTLCTIKDTVNINVKPAPVVLVSNDTTLCSGASTQLTATSPGNVKYNWSPAAGLSDVTINNPVANPSVTTQYNIQVQGANGCTSIDSVLVTVLPQPVVKTIADTAICDGTAIVLTTTANGTTYHWSPATGLSDVSQQSPLATPSQNIQYIVTVNPGTQCSIKDTVNIAVNQSPSVQVSNDTTLCNGTSVQLKAVSPGNVKYSWSPAESLNDVTINNPVANPAVTTQYYVQVEGANGCVRTDSTTVSVLPQPTVTAMADTAICNGTAIQLVTSVVNGNTYSWYPATGLSGTTQQSPMAKPTTNTQYIITVNPGTLCIAKDTVNIAVKAAPALQLPGDTTLCSGTSAQIITSSPDAVTYSWSPATGLNDPSSANPVANPQITTQYFLQVTGGNGCNSTDSIVISVLPQPTVATIADTAICQGVPVALTTTATDGNTYSWSPAAGLSGPAEQNPVANPAGNTQYIITVNQGSLCTAKDTVNITVNALPVVQAFGDTTLCAGASVQLKASSANNVTYSWSPATGLDNPAANTPVASPTSPTVYTVQAVDGNKCTAQASVTVNVIPKPVFGISPANKLICISDPLTITATGGDIYQWSPAETVTDPTAASTQVKPLSNTNYQVIVTNTTCKLADTLYSSIIVTDKLTTTISKSNDLDCVLASTTLRATGGNQYTWSPATSINQTNIANPVVSPLQTTTYYVLIKKNGCVATDSITVYVTPANADNAYKMASAFTPNGDGLNDCFGVKYWGGIKTFSFEVYNRWGNRLFYTTDPSKCWDGTYKGQYQPGGTYVYQIKAETICGNIYKKGTVVIIR